MPQNIQTTISDNLMRIHERMEKACLQAGRSSADVRLIAVSKTKPVEMIEAALHAGQNFFGENYVQEALGKTEALPLSQWPDLEWHLIGHLQTNKVRQLKDKFTLIHSIDRLKLIDEVAKAAASENRVQEILLQIHLGDEATKNGASLSEAPTLIERTLSHPSLRLRGLMSLPPLTDEEKVGRGYFATLRESLEQWRTEILSPEQAVHFTELSMGTSSDYEWAILEGATYIRVGTAIFGEREKN